MHQEGQEGESRWAEAGDSYLQGQSLAGAFYLDACLVHRPQVHQDRLSFVSKQDVGGFQVPA